MESGTEITDYPPIGAKPTIPTEDPNRQRNILIGVGFAALVFLVLLILAVVFLLNPATPTERIRDVFIIFMAIQSMLLGFALIILMIQLARLINLLQNEIKPILESTNDTVSNLRGTTTFLSDNIVEPVIKLNEYMAALTQVSKLVGLGRGRRKKNETPRSVKDV
jgi:predicted tellurium resistance membrane protein TerC